MPKTNHIKITNKGYGNRWKNFPIKYIGERPKLIRDDGGFTSGKNILEFLSARFKKFELILCDTKSRIKKKGKTYQVALSVHDLRTMNAGLLCLDPLKPPENHQVVRQDLQT